MQEIACISLKKRTSAPLPKEAVLCLGNFDGVHLAHRQLIKRALDLQRMRYPDAACGIFCFHTPSWDYLLTPPPSYLTSLEEKLELFARCGVEYVFLADFPSVRQLSPEIFVQRILVEKCHCIAAVCGYNYRFGAFGKGDPSLLNKLLNAPVITQGEVRDGEDTVSSTRIRRLLSEGRAEDAARLLTRPYTLTAPVIHGKGLGKTWGIPTINQEFPPKKQIPAKGVYVTSCTVDGVCYQAISNVGSHPTVDRCATVNCETYLLDFEGDLYGKTPTVSFLKFLRPEQRFASEEALTQQIHLDIARTREYFQTNF